LIVIADKKLFQNKIVYGRNVRWDQLGCRLNQVSFNDRYKRLTDGFEEIADTSAVENK
jgi:hypothetical protein